MVLGQWPGWSQVRAWTSTDTLKLRLLWCARSASTGTYQATACFYQPAFFIRSTASANRSFDVHTVIRIYPSPGAPDPLPGVVTIPVFSRRCAVKEADV